MHPTRPVGDERDKQRALRRGKLVALGFLLGAGVVYVLTRLFAGPAWVGYVQAAAEAGMVGALADWFAVTALFRHPLGLPIPHTAIIPRKKDAFGRNLGEFVGTNFLAHDVVAHRVAGADPARRVGAWLAQRRHAERVTAELATAVRGAVAVLRDEDVQAVLETAVIKRVLDRPWGPPLGRLLARVLDDGAHRRLVDLICDRAYEWVRDNEETVLRVVSEQAPAWSPRFVDDLVAERVYSEVLGFARAVRADPEHAMRKAVDRFLVEFAADLRTDPATIARAEGVKRQILEHPEVAGVLGSAWGSVKAMILDAADDPSSELRHRVRDGLCAFGDRLAADDELRSKVDSWLQRAAAYLVTNYRSEITGLISDTVERWDAEQTSRKVELQVGRDLQFIRINGAVVGALAGLAIHGLTQLFL